MTRDAHPDAEMEEGPAPSWRSIARRVRDGLARHRGSSADAVGSLLEALDRTASGRELAATTVGSRRAERQRAAIRLVEAALGLRLLDLGCDVRLEVLGPQGRRCDFLATRGDRTLAIHVKQMPPTSTTGRFSGRERSLESIPRPMAAAMRRRPMSEATWRRLSPELQRFLEQASTGEEQRHLDERGREVLSVRMLGPVPGGHLRLVPIGAGELDARVGRYRRLLGRAHGQFLPEHPNLILFGTLVEHPPAESLYALETALLGTQVERWDRYPRRGDRVAHGRADDGFWHGRRHEASRFAGWFSAASTEAAGPGGWWARGGAGVDAETSADEPTRRWLEDLLGPGQRPLGI